MERNGCGKSSPTSFLELTFNKVITQDLIISDLNVENGRAIFYIYMQAFNVANREF